jgi:hypothetical protein
MSTQFTPTSSIRAGRPITCKSSPKLISNGAQSLRSETVTLPNERRNKSPRPPPSPSSSWLSAAAVGGSIGRPIALPPFTTRRRRSNLAQSSTSRPQAASSFPRRPQLMATKFDYIGHAHFRFSRLCLRHLLVTLRITGNVRPSPYLKEKSSTDGTVLRLVEGQDFTRLSSKFLKAIRLMRSHLSGQ